jgi:hypothetical protein
VEKYKKLNAKTKTDNNSKSAKKSFLEDKSKDRGRNTSIQKKETKMRHGSEQNIARNYSLNKLQNIHNTKDNSLKGILQELRRIKLEKKRPTTNHINLATGSIPVGVKLWSPQL